MTANTFLGSSGISGDSLGRERERERGGSFDIVEK